MRYSVEITAEEQEKIDRANILFKLAGLDAFCGKGPECNQPFLYRIKVPYRKTYRFDTMRYKTADNMLRAVSTVVRNRMS